MAARIESLVLHAFGRLNGLSDTEQPEDYMAEISSAEDLDRMKEYGTETKQRLSRSL